MNEYREKGAGGAFAREETAMPSVHVLETVPRDWGRGEGRRDGGRKAHPHAEEDEVKGAARRGTQRR